MHSVNTSNNGFTTTAPSLLIFFFQLDSVNRGSLAATAVSTYERRQERRKGLQMGWLTEGDLKKPPQKMALGHVSFADQVRLEEKETSSYQAYQHLVQIN